MPLATRTLDTDYGHLQPGLRTTGDTLDRVPIHNMDALQNFFRTIRACRTGATDKQMLRRNDLVWQWRNLFDRTTVRPGSTQPANQLVLVDGTRTATPVSGTGETVDSIYGTAVAGAGGTLGTPAGYMPTGSPNVVTFATAAAYSDNIACVTLWAYNPSESQRFGSIIRGTAATDHLRGVLNTTDDTVELFSRVAGSDTEDGELSVAGDDAVTGTNVWKYAALGVTVTAADVAKVFLNGVLCVTDTTPTGASLTGHGVGFHFLGSPIVMPNLTAMAAFPI